MEHLKAVKFLENKKDYLFPNDNFSSDDIEMALIAAPDSFEWTMRGMNFRNPSTFQLISVFLGSLGVDRFYLGDIKKGILKYFSFGGFGIWWIKDIFSAKNRCRAYNCQKLMDAINDPSVVAQMQKTDENINKTIGIVKKFAPVVKEAVKGAKNVRDTFYVNK